jgi:hypothetical protein
MVNPKGLKPLLGGPSFPRKGERGTPGEGVLPGLAGRRFSSPQGEGERRAPGHSAAGSEPARRLKRS